MILTWSNGVGRVGNDVILVDIADSPVLPFVYDALYYEPDTGMILKIVDGAQHVLDADEQAACAAEAARLLAAADYVVQTYDDEGVYRGPLLKSAAEKEGLGHCLDAPDHPASKRIDDAWARIVAVIMDSGQLREMPDSICQLCLLTFTAAEWEAFPTRPATPYETWDFAAETWADKRVLDEVAAEARALIRRVVEDVRAHWLGGVPGLPGLEVSTWQKQEAEARAWLADRTAATPFIDQALEGRAVSKAEYCAEIMANAARAWRLLSHAHNLQYVWLDKVAACATVREVDAVVYALGDLGMPDPPADPAPAPVTLADVKSDANARIDAATSRAITAGFDYELTPPGGDAPERLHFSYDVFDQQNFADSANVATLAMSGVQGLPASVTWNAYRDWDAENGGGLARLSLDPAEFLALYTAGALAHKAARMEESGARKAAVEAAQSVEDVQALLAGWGL